jgi:hypothetical protein
VADLHLSGDPEADRLISDNPFALLVGMVLDQQNNKSGKARAPYPNARGRRRRGLRRVT